VENPGGCCGKPSDKLWGSCELVVISPHHTIYCGLFEIDPKNLLTGFFRQGTISPTSGGWGLLLELTGHAKPRLRSYALYQPEAVMKKGIIWV
jgi:hypothetical protein